LVECLTDNMNRTAANIRSFYSKGKGNLGTNGCVSFMFDRKGVLVIDKKATMVDDAVEEAVIEAGAEDFSIEDGYYEVITGVGDFAGVRDALSAQGYEFSMAELRYLPQTMTKLTNEEDIKYMQKLIDYLEDDDDVQTVYHNWEE